MVRAGQVKIDGATVADRRTRLPRATPSSCGSSSRPTSCIDRSNFRSRSSSRIPWIIVVDKPAGQIVHPAGRLQTGTLCNALQSHFDRQTAWPGLSASRHRASARSHDERPDRRHQGAPVAPPAFDPISKRAGFKNVLGAGRRDRRQADRGTIDVPIGTSAEAGSVLMSCQPDAGDPRPSITDFEVVERYRHHSLVRAHPRTGRNHQIRLHFAAIGHPVVGRRILRPVRSDQADQGRVRSPPPASRLTGRPPRTAKKSRSTSRRPARNRHALHAHRLEFEHPILGGASRLCLRCLRTSGTDGSRIADDSLDCRVTDAIPVLGAVDK